MSLVRMSFARVSASLRVLVFALFAVATVLALAQVFRDHAARVDLEVGLLDRVNSLLG